MHRITNGRTNRRGQCLNGVEIAIKTQSSEKHEHDLGPLSHSAAEMASTHPHDVTMGSKK